MANKKQPAAKARQEYRQAVKTSKPGEGKRSATLEKVFKAEGVQNPGALIGKIGRQKYGTDRMAQMAATGRKRAGKKKP